MQNLIKALDSRPRANLAHLPTPLEPLPGVSDELGLNIWVKRDDCTGLAMGGNKGRQLEFYLGDALEKEADTILITGAVQSNYVRMTAAAANKCGMDCHIQLEERVTGKSGIYRESGNVLLDKLLGATLHSYPVGEDEAGADRALEVLADELRAGGANPYVIHLGLHEPPLGALGYVRCALELLEQFELGGLDVGRVVVASGSSHTHAGLLFGLRAAGSKLPVTGICVRRPADQQRQRLPVVTDAIGVLLGLENPVQESDIDIYDGALAPGYGRLNDETRRAIAMMAKREGILLDPVYTGKVFAGLLQLAGAGGIEPGPATVFIHTGGVPALFGYIDELVG